jgi:N-acetylmuramoyl-L-alanine amidase
MIATETEATEARRTRRQRGGASSSLGVVLCVLCASVVSVPSPAWAARVRPRPAPTPDSRPDRGLYQEAQEARAALGASAKRLAQRAEWERAIMKYRRVVARYPQSAYCDDALMSVGDLYRQMATRFQSPRLNDDAVVAYRSLVEEYPSSRHSDDALYAVVGVMQKRADPYKLTEAARAYLEAFPRSARAPEVRALLKRRSPVQEASLPKAPPPGLAQVFNLRFWSGADSTRVVLDVEKPVKLHHERLVGPDRLFVDLLGTRLHPNLTHRSFPVGDGLLAQVRIAQNRDDVVRVVLDFKQARDHSVFYLENPTRLVVDVRGSLPPRVAGLAGGSAPSAGGPAASPEPFDGPPAEPAVPVLPSRRLPALAAPPGPAPAASPNPRPSAPTIELEGAPARTARREPSPSPNASPSPGPTPAAAASADAVPPSGPQANRAGSYSLARQLGLGARRIVIDAGHGGHDPGSIGPGGLQEKDLVLDVARRLEQLVRTELAAEVVMTRASDVFVPLEERTAIANSKGADLFLSIHANSSRSPRSRGVETYFLNFAADPHAEAVAARENAISAATLKDLQSLVKAITLNSKIDESRDFAASVQESMVASLKAHSPEIQDRGVRTAPFYVLIGANMPSVLAEISFVSNPEEERLLRTPEHRERIARGVFGGVRSYLESLNRARPRQLTAGPQRSTVAAKGERR